MTPSGGTEPEEPDEPQLHWPPDALRDEEPTPLRRPRAADGSEGKRLPDLPGGVVGTLTDRVMSLSTAVSDLTARIEERLTGLDSLVGDLTSRLDALTDRNDSFVAWLAEVRTVADDNKRLIEHLSAAQQESHEALAEAIEAARARPSIANLTEALGVELSQVAEAIDEVRSLVTQTPTEPERTIDVEIGPSVTSAITTSIDASLDGLRKELRSLRRPAAAAGTSATDEAIASELRELREEVARLKRRIALRSDKAPTRLDDADVERIASRVISSFEASFEIAADE